MTGRAELPDFSGAAWLVDVAVQRIFRALSKGSGEARIVGGAPRNAIIGVSIGDIDFAVTEPPETIMQLAKAAGIRSVATGIEHGTITLVTGRRGFEVTTLRRDIKTDGRHASVVFTKSWEEDAARRDFTMNAVYCDARGRVYDPVGGLGDILAGRVRFIGQAEARIREDYLRVLRFFRFFALFAKGDIDAKGYEACKAAGSGLGKLSAERIRAELLKLLVAPRAAEAARFMSDAGIFIAADLGRALPENLARLVRFEAAMGVEADPVRRLWVLLGGGSAPESRAEALAGRLRMSSAERRHLQLMAVRRGVLPSLSQNERRAALYALGERDYQDHVLLNRVCGDAAADDAEWRELFELPRQWAAPEFPVSGADIMARGIAKGPEVGRILRELENWWINAGFPEDRAETEAQITALITGNN